MSIHKPTVVIPLPDLSDVQNHISPRTIDIDKVGVKNISYPIVVLDKFNGTQHTVARINMYVNLPHRHKGTHMSRFIEILSECRRDVSLKKIGPILEETRRRLHAQSAHIEMTFPYFIDKEAPVTKARGLMEYICTFTGALYEDGRLDLVVGITVPITTLCPCSKEISQVGAHNQRGRCGSRCAAEVLLDRRPDPPGGGVGLLRGLRPLKRQDEKHVTEKAYANPMFVEDVVREIAHRLSENDNFTWYTVESENFESIHNHSAYAHIESK